MRIGQMSRNLGVSISNLVKAIKDQSGEKVGVHPNTKLTDEQVDFLTQEFKEHQAESQISTEKSEPQKETPKSEKPTSVLTEEALLEREKQNAETIERERVKLSGPKVLDKIELSESIIKDFKEKKDRKKLSPKHQEQLERKNEKPKKVKVKAEFTLESVEAYLENKKKQEERKLENEKRKKLYQEKKLKDLKKQNYLKQVNLEKPKKKKKPYKVEEKPVYVQKQLEKQNPKPPKKSLWQKLFGIFGK